MSKKVIVPSIGKGTVQEELAGLLLIDFPNPISTPGIRKLAWVDSRKEVIIYV